MFKVKQSSHYIAYIVTQRFFDIRFLKSPIDISPVLRDFIIVHHYTSFFIKNIVQDLPFYS